MADRQSDGDLTVDVSKRRAAPPRDAAADPSPLPADEPGVARTPDEPDFVPSEQGSAIAEEPLAAVPGGGGSSFGGGSGTSRRGDRVFLGLTGGSSLVVIAVVVLIAIFLIVKAVPAIANNSGNFFGTQWVVGPNSQNFGISGLLYTTVLSSLLALLVAVPLSIGIALFITQYAPRSVARPIAYAIDLLAAVPSIIYGVWAFKVLAPELTPVQDFLSHIGLGLFKDEGIPTGTVFDLGIVLAIMIIPIVTAISRDVFERTPRANVEAALALGSTRWEMIRMAVLPYGRAGVVSGSMLGLGRALGETIAALIILSTASEQSYSLFSPGSTIAGKIALDQAEFGPNPGPYIAAGLVLFVLTFLVNGAARAIVNRRKDFA